MFENNKNIVILEDTLSSFLSTSDNKRIKEIQVYLPEDMEQLKISAPQCQVKASRKCVITCDNADTYTIACKMYRKLYPRKDETEEIADFFEFDDSVAVEYKVDEEETVKCMVLNFANPYKPGGGVRNGANAQEENLCRRSSLLLSLETDEAKKYYDFNKKYSIKDEAGNDYGTNALMLSPYVEVIKDKNYEKTEYAKVAVLTAAMPIIKNKLEISEDYPDIVFQRINSVLLIAAHYGYTHLVLGAWGCGAFENDPETVAKLFRDAIDNFNYNGKNIHQLFKRISFAVPYNEKKPANHLVFKEQFTV